MRDSDLFRVTGTMAASLYALLIIGVGAVLAFPQQGKESKQPSWWPDNQPWPPQIPEGIQLHDSIQRFPQEPVTNALQTSKETEASHPEPIGFSKEAPDWWPQGWEWPPFQPDWIPWPPAQWFPKDAPKWWPQSWDWPPTHPDWIPWPPSQWFPKEAPGWWPQGLEWPPSHPSWIPWPPTHPEWIPWPPAHPEVIPWPPSGWFPKDAPEWWPNGWAWPPPHPHWIPTNPSHPEWIPWPLEHPDWIPTKVEDFPYIPSRDNQFHLFTRANPSTSQPILYQNPRILHKSNYEATKRTVVLMHDLGGSVLSQFNAVLVRAFLAAADVNVICVDWRGGGGNSNAVISTIYAAVSSGFVSNFITWLVEESNADLADFHLVGVGVGGLKVGLIGHLLGSKVGYITALDPARGPSITSLLPPMNFKVALYTEVIHTDTDGAGYAQPLGDVDFYPNGGRNMPGCSAVSACNRLMSVLYFAESLVSGGFTGVSCRDYANALQSNCFGYETLNMGGLEPKTGSSGIFYMSTNDEPPFSRG